ncbi:MAG: type II toxin-antitoxin system PemK/MazF family toxin [Polyangiales bacterium]
MRRGELYRARRPGRVPKRSRVFLVVSRQALVDSRFPTVVCAPIHTQRHGLATELPVGVDEGLKHDSSAYCDALVSLPKTALTDYVGALPDARLTDLARALRVALAVE